MTLLTNSPKDISYYQTVCWSQHPFPSFPGETSNETAPIRLVGGDTPYEGRIEVLYNGIWGTVCDEGWSLEDAHVACRQLGLGPALAATDRAEFGQGEGVVWLSDLECTGTEEALSECNHPGWAFDDCSHVEDAGVVCSGKCMRALTLRGLLSHV